MSGHFSFQLHDAIKITPQKIFYKLEQLSRGEWAEEEGSDCLSCDVGAEFKLNWFFLEGVKGSFSTKISVALFRVSFIYFFDDRFCLHFLLNFLHAPVPMLMHKRMITHWRKFISHTRSYFFLPERRDINTFRVTIFRHLGCFYIFFLAMIISRNFNKHRVKDRQMYFFIGGSIKMKKKKVFLALEIYRSILRSFALNLDFDRLKFT